MRNLISLLISVFFAIVALGLLVALFAIGLVVLWYFLIIVAVIWAARTIYYFFKGTPPPSVVQRYDRKFQQKTSKGRIIEPDE